MNPDPARAPGAPRPSADHAELRSEKSPEYRSRENPAWDDQSEEDADGEQAFKPLTADEAAALKARLPVLSPWVLVGWQLVAGVVMVALWGVFSRDGDKAWSALCGAGSVVVPGALMAWGTTRRSAMNAGTAVLSFMVWELIKMIVAVAILVAVVLRYPALSWPALLTAMVVCLKANWLALLRQGRIRK